MAETTLEQKIYNEIAIFDGYDALGAITGSQDEFFKRMGEPSSKVQNGALSS